MQEMLAEARAIGSSRPVSGAELAAAQSGLTLELPGSNETSGQVAGTLSESVRYGLDPRWHEQFVSRVQALDTSTVDGLAQSVIHSDTLTWVIIGDLDRIETDIRALELGPVRTLDVDGLPVAAR